LKQVRIGIATIVAAAVALFSVTVADAQTPTPAPSQQLDVALRTTVQGAVDAWNRRDVEGFLSFFTDRGLTAVFDFSSRAEARQFLPEFIGTDRITLRSLTEAQLSGARATAVVDLVIGSVLERGRWEFTLDTGTPKIDGETPLSAPIPSGTTAVDLRLVEYAFLYDRNALVGGNVSFRVANAGVEPHEVILVKINRPEPLLDIVRSSPPDQGPPAGIESIGQSFYEPGQQTNLVLTQTLSAGRYGLLCFVSAPDGTPHALKGMISEFTVGTATQPTTPGTGGVVPAPPKTGNAGLLSQDRTAPVMAAALLAMLAIALGGGAWARSRR
jgi:hypothetical protein